MWKRGEQVCAACRRPIVPVDSGFGTLYVDSRWMGSCHGERRGVHWP